MIDTKNTNEEINQNEENQTTKTIHFTIKAKMDDSADKEEQIEFMVEFNEEGELSDSASYNAVKGWVAYGNFMVGWSEQDDDLNELLYAIRDYSCSMAIEELLFDATEEDIGRTYHTSYFCDGYVSENREYSFEVCIDDVSVEGL